MHVASFVLGIIAIITCLVPFFGAAVALIALIIAIAAMCVKRPNNEGKGLKIAGLVLSIIAFVISLLMTGTILLGAKYIADSNEEIIQDIQNATSAAELSNAKTVCSLAYVDGLENGLESGKADGVSYNECGNVMTAEDYYKVVAENLEETVTEIKSKYIITVNEKGMPTVEINTDKNNNNNVKTYKINTIAEAEALMEKYKCNLGLSGEHYYYNEVGDLFVIQKTNVSGRIPVSIIENSNAYKSGKDLLNTANFEEYDAKYCSYTDVLKTKKKYFGPNATVERETCINCPNSWFYLEDYDYFVQGGIACGSGLSLLRHELSVYDLKNIDDTTVIYAKQVHVSANHAIEVTSIRKDKYTFKLYNDELYLYSVEEIENTYTERELK